MTYIVMSRIAGVPIRRNWNQRSTESKARLMKQLTSYLQEMRSLKPPNPGAVESVGGGKLYNGRLSDGIQGFGPFDSVHAFHFFLRNGIGASPTQIPAVNKLVEMHEKGHFSTRFTHGDLNSTNILVDGDSIVGFVDWDTAGWQPEYWEYTSAYEVNPYDEFWRDEVGKFIEEYPDALEMEQIRQQYFGDF